MIGVYFESWTPVWTSNAKSFSLSQVEKPVDVVYLAFCRPDCNYKKGQKTFAETGLDFSVDFQVVVDSIAILKKKGILVMLAVGGATFPFHNLYAKSCVLLMNDLGCDGIDIDWEPADGVKSSGKLGDIIGEIRSYIGPYKKLSMAGFSTGCLAANGDTFRGMCIPGLQSHGVLLDWVNVMAYDAGKDFDVLNSYNSYKKYFTKTVNIGFQVGVQGWGDGKLDLDQVVKACDYVASGDGCFIWAYFKSGDPSTQQVIDKAFQTFLKKQPLSQCKCPNCGYLLTVK